MVRLGRGWRAKRSGESDALVPGPVVRSRRPLGLSVGEFVNLRGASLHIRT